MSACPTCLRRAWLLAAVSGRLEVAFRGRDALRDVLALDDLALIEAVAPGGGDDLRARRERFDVAAAHAASARTGLRTTCPHDPAFPRALTGMPGGPRALFVAGALDRLRAWVPAVGDDEVQAPPAVAIVGTRRASAEALEMARALGRGLAAAGVTVVSGMALVMRGLGDCPLRLPWRPAVFLWSSLGGREKLADTTQRRSCDL